MANKVNKPCPHCGQNMAAYDVSLTPMLMGAVRKMIKAVREKGVNDVHLRKDANLTSNEFSNIARLRYHGMVAKVYTKQPDGTKKREQGRWLVTRRAADFIKGNITLPRTLTIFDRKIIERSDEHVTMSQVMGSTPYLDTINDIRYHEMEKNQIIGQMELV